MEPEIIVWRVVVQQECTRLKFQADLCTETWSVLLKGVLMILGRSREYTVLEAKQNEDSEATVPGEKLRIQLRAHIGRCSAPVLYIAWGLTT